MLGSSSRYSLNPTPHGTPAGRLKKGRAMSTSKRIQPTAHHEATFGRGRGDPYGRPIQFTPQYPFSSTTGFTLCFYRLKMLLSLSYKCANPEARDTGGGRRIGDGAGAVALKA
eukprot:scaffold4939_cov95-Skeletonema_dohrnii-CCMP3373.AAC.4